MLKPARYDRPLANRAIFDRSIPLKGKEVLRDPVAEEMIKKAGEMDHYRAFIPALRAAFPSAAVLVKREFQDDEHVTIELRFPSNGLKMRPEVTKFMDGEEGRRKDYFLLVVS
jgi:hypothetical protein